MCRRGFAACFVMWALSFFCPSAAAIIAGDGASARALVLPNATNSPWSGVGRLETASGKSFTASVIGPRHILTAAHAALSAKPDEFSFLLYTNGNEPYRIKVERVSVHPDYRGFKPGKDGVVRDDLAILELADMVPFGVAVYPLLLRQIPAGTPILMVGYGVSGDGVAGVKHGSGMGDIKRAGANVADSLVAADGDDNAAKAFMFDFDGPDAATNVMGGAALGNGVEATLGEGDSGCPVFVQVRNQWLLAGVGTFVTSFNRSAVPGVFGSGGGGMLLSGYGLWIRQSVPQLTGAVALSVPGVAPVQTRQEKFKEVAIRQKHVRNPAATRARDNAGV